jgi:hypothetical protein
VNFLALLVGTMAPIRDFSLDELSQSFDLSRVHKSAQVRS